MSVIVDILNWIANFVNVISFVGFLVSAAIFLQKRRQYQRLLEWSRPGNAVRPMAFAIGIPWDIENAVRRYLADNGMDMPIEYIHRPGTISYQGYAEACEEVRAKKLLMTRAGITELHLFSSMPVALAPTIGAIMSNWVPVICYDYKDGEYHKAIVMDRRTTVG